MSKDRERLRATFSGAAELYDKARPSYPAQLVDDLVSLTGLTSGSSILEIGPGTGQLTLPLAERGFQIVAIELGEELAKVARRNLAKFSNVEVHRSAFEDWPLPGRQFDAVVSATSFHWVDPAVRYKKCAEALRDGGSLGIVSTHHVAGGDEEFFARVQDCYEMHMPGTPPGLRLHSPEEVESRDPLIGASGFFEPPEFRDYVWEVSYSRLEYLEVLMTYSGHRDLDESLRKKLLDCIAELIDSRFGGKVRKAYLNRLLVARKLPRSS